MSAAGVVRPTSEDSAAVPPARIRLRWRTLLGGVVASVGTAVLATWPLATALDGAVPTNQWHCLGRGCEDDFLCVWIVTARSSAISAHPGAHTAGSHPQRSPPAPVGDDVLLLPAAQAGGTGK